MTIAFIVTLDRFKKEYDTHVALQKNKVVNWHVDKDTGFLKLYIYATHGNEIYCYEHKGTYDELPETVREFIKEEGQILGIVEFGKNKPVKQLPTFGGLQA